VSGPTLTVAPEHPAVAALLTEPTAIAPPVPPPPPTTSATPPAPPITLARQPINRAPSPAPAPTSGRGLASGGGGLTGGGGGGGGGTDIDHIYRELLRRLREEREQLGQAINEPF
jgi:hypothetical protein